MSSLRCDMKVVKETPDPEFGVFGTKVHQMVCGECGGQTTRTFSRRVHHGFRLASEFRFAGLSEMFGIWPVNVTSIDIGPMNVAR